MKMEMNYYEKFYLHLIQMIITNHMLSTTQQEQKMKMKKEM